MPRKERPAPLSDSIFRAKLGQDIVSGGVQGEALPVHNTFIQFGVPEDLADDKKRGFTTAPAFHSALQSAVQSALQEQTPAPAIAADGTPKRVSVTQYNLSSSSTRAPGLDRTGSGSGTGTTQDAEDDGESGEEGSLTRPPCYRPGELPSQGSAKHAEGLCKRCCFFPKGRCLNGRDCEFCHFEHEKRKRKKKKKGSKQKESGSDAEADSTPGEDLQQPSTGDSLRAPVNFAGLPLRPPPPLEPATPVEPALLGPYDAMMWGAPPLDAQTLRSLAGLPLTAPPAQPPQDWPDSRVGSFAEPAQGVPVVAETAAVLKPPTVPASAPTDTNFANGYGAAIATAAFVLEGSSPADRGSGPGGPGGPAELKVPTYTPLPGDASMRAYAAAASGLQANGTVPPTAPPIFGRPPPR